MVTSRARRAIAAVAFLGAASSASATSTGIDYTDIWWAGTAENGWGINLMEQGTTIFATMFVYGPDGTPRWYTGQMNSGGTTTFSGSVYATTGTYWGATYNPNALTINPVGTMSVNFSSAYAGTLNYTINGVNVTKNIVRQTFGNNNLAGTYMGGLAANGTSCGNGVTNGGAFMNGSIVVTQSAQNVSMKLMFYSDAGYLTTCTFNGVLAAQGSMGQIANASFSCTAAVNGSNVASNAGSFSLDNMTMTTNGFSGVFNGKDQYCTYNGWFGGIKAPS